MIRPSRRAVVAGLSALGLLPTGARAATPSIEAKFIIEDRRLWVSASVNGSEPLLFVVDTGADRNFLRPEIAKKLKLPLADVGSVGGVGGKTANTGIVVASEIAIGGAMRQQRVIFNTLDMSRGFPNDAAGIFAAGLFTARDTDLDFVHGLWRIWPKGRESSPRGVKLDDSAITLFGGRDGSQRMYATAQIDGKLYRLCLDTGAPASLLLFPRAAARSGLFDTKSFAPHNVSGVGGRASRLGRIVRAERLEFGSLALKRPFVSMMDPAETSTFPFDGLLGLPIMSLFDIATDAGLGKIWAARNTLKATADPYGRSGLWLDRKGDTTTVSVVGKGSPAEAAGIAVGDILTAPSSMSDAVRAINGDADREVTLSMRRGTAVREVKLTLADYL